MAVDGVLMIGLLHGVWRLEIGVHDFKHREKRFCQSSMCTQY